MLKVWQYREIDSESISDPIERMIIYVALMEELDIEQVEDWNSSDLVKKYNELCRINEISDKYQEQIRIKNTILTLINFSHISLGQFIDIEEWIKEGLKLNFHKIVAALYVIQKENGLKENTVESYEEINVPLRAELIDELPINNVHGAVQLYLNFRDKFFKSYDIFKDPFEGVNVDELDEEEQKIFQEEQAKAKKDEGAKWMRLLNILSNGDVSKFDKLLKMNLFLAFNQLSYLVAETK